MIYYKKSLLTMILMVFSENLFLFKKMYKIYNLLKKLVNQKISKITTKND